MDPQLVIPPPIGHVDEHDMWRKAKVIVGNAGECVCGAILAPIAVSIINSALILRALQTRCTTS